MLNLTKNGRLLLDEDSFTELLSAAYIMQQHQGRIDDDVPSSGLTQVLTHIVETQQQIRSHKLDTQAALDLITTRLQKMVGAVGASIALLDKSELHYRSASGSSAVLAGSHTSVQSSLSYRCITTGETLRTKSSDSKPAFNSAVRHGIAAHSLLAVPIFYEGKVAGAIELYFAEATTYGDGDVRACELMAGLVTEVLVQTAQDELKHELAAERASVLLALEKLKPQLEKLAAEGTVSPPAPALVAPATPAEPKLETEICKACGNAFVGNESYCGVCGASRATGKYPGTDLQSKWATLWEKQVAQGELGLDHAPVFRKPVPHDARSQGHENSLSDLSHQDDLPELPQQNDNGLRILPDAENSTFHSHIKLAHDSEGNTALTLQPDQPTLLELQNTPGTFASDLTLRARQLLFTRAGDLTLGLAAFALLVALLWGFWPTRQNPNTTPSNTIASTGVGHAVKRRPKPKEPELTLLEKAMVSVGLAEPPPAPVYMGNPEAKVWVDVTTALYYCQGETLFGTTPKGKYTTQGDAQQDAFQPAYRKPCE